MISHYSKSYRQITSILSEIMIFQTFDPLRIGSIVEVLYIVKFEAHQKPIQVVCSDRQIKQSATLFQVFSRMIIIAATM